MHILFVADPLASFKIYKDTTFAMMREAQQRGHHVLACEPHDILWQSGQKVTTRAQRIRLTGNVAGQPPFRGSLKHHGWVATGVRLPALSESLDPRMLAPAEVEL